jgi:hypothetical protein
MNTFITSTWIHREGLIVFFTRLGASATFIEKLRTMSDTEIERLNARVCKSLSAIDFNDE